MYNYPPILIAVFTGFQTLLWLVVYVWLALCLHIIANKTDTSNPWLAWIPIANIYRMCKVADKPGWWLILFFIPLVNIVMSIIVWMAIAEARHQPSWLGVLIIIPIANFVIPWVLTFADQLHLLNEAVIAKQRLKYLILNYLSTTIIITNSLL